MIRLKPLIMAGAIAVLPSCAFANTLLGDWQRGDGNVRIRIAACGESLCATNTWVKDSGSGEKVGEKLIFAVTQQGDGWAGSAYDPQRKLTISTKLKVIGKRLTSSGCVLSGVICRSVDWMRLD
jgi:uncharacterized protein (DUF2147 family)